MLKEICIWAVSFLMLGASLRYSYQIRKKDGISPTLSTWIIFFIGTLLSLITYAIAEKKDFRSGILNTVDVMATTIICISIIIWKDRKIFLNLFEKWYLSGIGIITIYGVLSENIWSSNVFIQIIIGLGYIPTINTLLIEKRNTESFTTWGIILLSSIFSIYPTIENGNTLALIYTIRTIICVSSVMIFMIFYHFQSKK